MKPSLVKAWAADLRSGKFAQASGTLHRVDGFGPSPTERAGYCCLGVLSTRICRLKAVKATGWKWDGVRWVKGRDDLPLRLPSEVRQAVGLSASVESALINANDWDDLSFPQIADEIERSLLGDGA